MSCSLGARPLTFQKTILISDDIVVACCVLLVAVVRKFSFFD